MLLLTTESLDHQKCNSDTRDFEEEIGSWNQQLTTREAECDSGHATGFWMLERIENMKKRIYAYISDLVKMWTLVFLGDFAGEKDWLVTFLVGTPSVSGYPHLALFDLRNNFAHSNALTKANKKGGSRFRLPRLVLLRIRR